MLTKTSRDEHADALRIVGDGNALQVFSGKDFASTPTHTFEVFRREERQWHAAPLIEEGPNSRWIPAVAHKHVDVFGAENDHDLPAEERVVAPRLNHRRSDGMKHSLAHRAARVVDHDMRVDSNNRYGAVRTLEAALDGDANWVLVLGSFYLAGELRPLLVERAEASGTCSPSSQTSSSPTPS